MKKLLSPKLVIMLLVINVLLFGSVACAFADSLLVKLVSGLDQAAQSAVIVRNGGTETATVPALRLHVIDVPNAILPAVMQSYQSDPQVERVELNVARKASADPTDPEYVNQNQWALPQIGWPAVFGTITPTGSATVALLDTGVDAAHPDLAGKVLSGTSILNGLDDLSNGLSDSNGHGTSMAGIIAAATDNGTGVAGIGYAGVRVMPVTVLDASGNGNDSDIIAGIIWAVEHGANVILMPFSNPAFSQNLQDAIDFAWDNGVVLVAATGNDGVDTPTFPAGDRGVIGVSATDETDLLVPDSNYGQDTFLAAPGINIMSTGLGGGYASVSGTSASAAIVAGVAAFMKAVDPLLSNGVIVGRLARTADSAGIQTETGNGRVNMAAALANISTDPVQPAGAAPVGEGGPFVGPYVAAGRVNSGTGNTGANTATSFTVTMPVALTDGNTLVAVISTRSTTADRVASITQTGAVWARVTQATNTNGTTTEIWYAPNVLGAGTIVTINLNPAVRAAAVISEYNGVLTASPLDQNASSTGSGTSASTGTTPATTQENEIWIGGIGLVRSSYTLTAPTNSFSIVNNAASTSGTAANNARVYALERTVNSIGTATTGGTVSASSQWSGAIATFKVVPHVQPLTPWATLHAGAVATGTTNTTSASVFNAGTGQNRVLLVGVTADSTTTGNAWTVNSVTYGGVAVTPIATTAATGNRSMSWIGYIPDSQIPAGSNNVVVNLTSGNAVSRLAMFAGSYMNAAQTAPVGAQAAKTAASTSATLSLPYTASGESILLVNLQANDTGATYAPTAFTSTLWSSNANGSSNIASRAVPTSSGTDSITVSGLANARNSIVGVSITQTKFTPSVTTWPTATGISYGQALSDSILSGGTALVPGTFAFTTPGTTPPAGTYGASVTFTPFDTTNYNTVGGTVNVAVGLATQTIGAIGFTPATVNVGGTTTASATGGASGNPVVFTSTTPVVCSATGTNGATISALSAGTCTIAANQAGNANYSAATQATGNIVPGLNSQTITVTTPAPGTAAYNAQFTVAATAPGGTVIYSSGTPLVCTNVGALFTMVSGAGTCTVQYNQAGNGTYSAAPQVTSNTTASLATQTIGAIGFTPATVNVGGTTTASATGGASGNPVVFTSTTPVVCSATGTNGATISALSAGTCTIAANQAGSANYSAATQATGNIVPGLNSQTITVTTPAPGTAAYNAQFTVAATAPGGTVIYSSGTPLVCTNVGALFTMVSGAGTCTVQYNQAGNGTYSAAPQVTSNTTASLATQTIGAIGFTPATVNVGGTTTASATGGASGNPVVFTSTTPVVCSATGTNGATISALSAGTCTIAANQAGSANYSAATQATKNISVILLTYTVRFIAGPNGILTGPINQIVNPGASTAAVTAIPATGYHLVNWTGTGYITDLTNPLSLTNVTADITVTANFALNTAPPTASFSKSGATFNIYRSEGGIQAATPVYSGPNNYYTDTTTLKHNTSYQYETISDTDPTSTVFMVIRTPLYNGWNVIAVPYATGSSPASSFFASPVSAIYEWVPSGANMEGDTTQKGTYNAVATLSPGKGYFVKASNSSTMLVNTTGTANTLPKTVTLNPGWNMIANPITSNRTDIGTNWLIDGQPLATAITGNRIGGGIYWWNGTTYDSWSIMGVNPQIEPWKGYWIVNQTSSPLTLTIQ